MPVSYQDFVLSNQYFGTPMPTDPQMKMELAPIVYQNMRTIGARPSRLQQGLRAVGRGLAIAGGAGLAVGVANSLFNKPSDNYEQAVTDNQTSGGRNTRVGQLDSFDDFFETDNEKYAKTGGLGESTPPSKSTTPAQTVSITDKVENFTDRTQYDSPIGPHSLASATGIGRKPRIAKLAGSEFSQALRHGDPAANVAAVQDENMRARWSLYGPLSEVKGVYGPVDRSKVGGQHGMSLTEEEAFRLKTGQSRATYGNTPKTKEERRYQYKNPLITNHDELFARDEEQRIKQDEYNRTAQGMEDQFRGAVDRDTYVPTTTEKVEQFINKTKSGKNLPEKKTQKVSDLGERREDNASAGMKAIIAAGGEAAKEALLQTPDDERLEDLINDPSLEAIGKTVEPKRVSPNNAPSQKANPLATLDQVVSEGGTSNNPIIGGLQSGIKTGRVLGSVIKRGAQDTGDVMKKAENFVKGQVSKAIRAKQEQENPGFQAAYDAEKEIRAGLSADLTDEQKIEALRKGMIDRGYGKFLE